MMEAKIQTSQSAEVTYNKEVRMQKLLNIFGIFIFGGLALTNLTNPLPSSDYTKEILFLLVEVRLFITSQLISFSWGI